MQDEEFDIQLERPSDREGGRIVTRYLPLAEKKSMVRHLGLRSRLQHIIESPVLNGVLTT